MRRRRSKSRRCTRKSSRGRSRRKSSRGRSRRKPSRGRSRRKPSRGRSRRKPSRGGRSRRKPSRGRSTRRRGKRRSDLAKILGGVGAYAALASGVVAGVKIADWLGDSVARDIEKELSQGDIIYENPALARNPALPLPPVIPEEKKRKRTKLGAPTRNRYGTLIRPSLHKVLPSKTWLRQLRNAPSNPKFFTMGASFEDMKALVNNPPTYTPRIRKGVMSLAKRPVRLRRIHELLEDDQFVLRYACYFRLNTNNYRILDTGAQEIMAHFENSYDSKLRTQDIHKIKKSDIPSKLRDKHERLLNKKSFVSIKITIPGHSMALFILRDIHGNDEVILTDPNNEFKNNLQENNINHFRFQLLSLVYNKFDSVRVKILKFPCINVKEYFEQTCSIANDVGGICALVSQFVVYLLLSSGVRPYCVAHMIKNHGEKFLYLFALFHGEIARIYSIVKDNPTVDPLLYSRLSSASYFGVEHKVGALPKLDSAKITTDNMPRSPFTTAEVRAFKQGSSEASAVCGEIPELYMFGDFVRSNIPLVE